MKSIRLLLILLALFGTMFSADAQRRVVKVYPRIGTVVTSIQHPRVIVHRGINFHFANGVWYRARGRKFVVTAAPVGVQIRHLPRGNRIVHVNGRRLYRYKGVWYRRHGRGFAVVHV